MGLRILATIALVSLSCADAPTGLGTVRDVGVVRYFEYERIEVPDTVRVGEAYEVLVTTYWTLECLLDGSTRVEREETETRIIPIDRYVRDSDSPCIDIVDHNEHVIELSHDGPGRHTIVIVGREIGRNRAGAPLEIHRTVVVVD